MFSAIGFGEYCETYVCLSDIEWAKFNFANISGGTFHFDCFGIIMAKVLRIIHVLFIGT